MAALEELNQQLVVAAEKGNIADIVSLLDQGADIEYEALGGRWLSPLRAAIGCKQKASALLLLQRGARVDLQDQVSRCNKKAVFESSSITARDASVRKATREGYKKLRAGDLLGGLKEVTVLKGIGPVAGSLILSLLDRGNHCCYMSEEAVTAIIGSAEDKAFTPANLKAMTEELASFADGLNKLGAKGGSEEGATSSSSSSASVASSSSASVASSYRWTANEVQRAVWARMIARQMGLQLETGDNCGIKKSAAADEKGAATHTSSSSSSSSSGSSLHGRGAGAVAAAVSVGSKRKRGEERGQTAADDPGDDEQETSGDIREGAEDDEKRGGASKPSASKKAKLG